MRAEQCSFTVVEGDPHKGKRQDGQGTLEESICLVAILGHFWFDATADCLQAGPMFFVLIIFNIIS